MEKKNNRYPKAVWYILGNELCERISYYGLKAVLILFCTTIQKYDNDTSTIIIHMFMVFQSISTLFGAIIADSYWGKYKLKTWLRSTMGQNRLSGLALLHVHRSISINIDKIIDTFSQMKKRNIDFII